MALSKSKVMAFVAIGGCIISAGAAAVGTYRAYPKIQEAKEKNMGFFQTVGYVGVEFVPALAAAGMTIGSIAMTQIFGEEQARKFEMQARRAKNKFEQAKTMYTDQSKAISDEADRDTQKRIEENVQKRESERTNVDIQFATKERFFDPITEQCFEGYRADILKAVYDANKELTLNSATYYFDFCERVGEDVEPDLYSHMGWSTPTASAMWVEPWIEVEFVENYKMSNGETATLFRFMGDGGGNGLMPYDPVDDPDNEQGQWW